MIHLIFLTLLPLASSLAAQPNPLRILDAGIGHRSVSIPRWPTSLRSVSEIGQDSTILAQYGPPPNNRTAGLLEPVGASDIAYDAKSQSLFLATGQGLLRTNVNGSDVKTVWSGNDVVSIAVSTSNNTSANGKIFFGTRRNGLIYRANPDGSNAQVFRDVSQGRSKWGFARSYAAGIHIDSDAGYIYYTASRGSDGGSIRRIRISKDGGEGEEEVLFEGLNMPKKIRVKGDVIYWCEKGRWSNSPTSLSRAKIPPASPSNITAAAVKMEKEILVHSDHTVIFFEKDFTGDVQTLGITGFAFDSEGKNAYFVMESSGRQVFAKLVRVGLVDKSLKLESEDVGALGVPVGIEFVGKVK